jgi:GNAT superfamily N-acetyltransferase
MNRTQARWPEIRQAGYADQAAIRDFLDALSLRARYLRFFTGALSASPSVLRVLAGGGDHIDAIVAVEDGVIIGHAMAADTPSSATEIGVVVTDACQGRGIGSALIRTLAARARGRGITTATMDVLTENRQVLAMITDHWPAARHDVSGPCTTIRVPLPQPGGRPGDARGPADTAREPGGHGTGRTEEHPRERLAIPY